MSPILSSLLFASAVSAQITTTATILGGQWSILENVGYYASVVRADASHTVLALSFDNQTAPILKSSRANVTWTATFGPTAFEYRETYHGPTTTISVPASRTDAFHHLFSCDRPAPTGDATCTLSRGIIPASIHLCNGFTRAPENGPRTQVASLTYPYSSRSTAPAGTATLRQTFVLGEVMTWSRPSWCTVGIPATFTGLTSVYTVPSSDIHVNQVVITAGIEKLNATSPSPSTTGPSGSGVTTTGGAASTFTGAAVPIKTMVPAAALGLGVAMAAFVL